jgi:SAM-dependent methyltransferase
MLSSYVFYSNYATLAECQACGLWYSDLRLPDETLRGHFERSYKGEGYFRRRGRILEHLARVVSRAAPEEGTVIDVGGAEGHLLRRLKSLRRDLRLTLTDTSSLACHQAAGITGVEVFQGSIAEMIDRAWSFDVVVLSDVIYYEPNLEALWSALERWVAPGGIVVIRIPNRWRWIRGRFFTGGQMDRADIRGFNPDHLYVFTPGFLARELKHRGFTDLRLLPSPLLGTGPSTLIAFWALRAVGALLPGGPRTPGMLLTAKGPRR